ncbi:hypothetical protein MMC31_003213 [Peltigera leucophlebia]|nr:hypothetical protein [Peltigera leucophlebia]
MNGPDQSRRGDWSQDETRPLLNTEAEVLSRDNYSSLKSSEKRWSNTLPLSVALFGAFLASADDSFVIATYSTIASEFHRHSDGQWILMAYNMGYCYALPIVLHVSIEDTSTKRYGNVSDIFGRKRPLLIAYCLFGLGSIVS